MTTPSSSHPAGECPAAGLVAVPRPVIRLGIECWIRHDSGCGPGLPAWLLLWVPSKDGKPGFWQPITGGIEPGETPEQACIREIWEETGFQVGEASLELLSERVDVPISTELVVQKTLFRTHVKSVPPVRISRDEHCGFAWVEPEAVSDMLYWDSNVWTWQLVREAVNS